MANLENLKSAVEKKSGQKPVSFNLEELRSLLGFKVVGSMRENGFHPSIIAGLQGFNDKLEALLGNPDGSEYLTSLTAKENFWASGIIVFSFDSIKKQLHELEPGAILFRHGYLPIAASADNEIVCFHWPANQVVWTGHTVFCEDFFSFKNPVTNWELLPLTAENISKALVPLATNLKCFLSDMLDDKFEKPFAKLN